MNYSIESPTFNKMPVVFSEIDVFNCFLRFFSNVGDTSARLHTQKSEVENAYTRVCVGLINSILESLRTGDRITARSVPCFVTVNGYYRQVMHIDGIALYDNEFYAIVSFDSTTYIISRCGALPDMPIPPALPLILEFVSLEPLSNDDYEPCNDDTLSRDVTSRGGFVYEEGTIVGVINVQCVTVNGEKKYLVETTSGVRGVCSLLSSDEHVLKACLHEFTSDVSSYTDGMKRFIHVMALYETPQMITESKADIADIPLCSYTAVKDDKALYTDGLRVHDIDETFVLYQGKYRAVADAFKVNHKRTKVPAFRVILYGDDDDKDVFVDCLLDKLPQLPALPSDMLPYVITTKDGVDEADLHFLQSPDDVESVQCSLNPDDAKRLKEDVSRVFAANDRLKDDAYVLRGSSLKDSALYDLYKVTHIQPVVACLQSSLHLYMRYTLQYYLEASMEFVVYTDGIQTSGGSELAARYEKEYRPAMDDYFRIDESVWRYLKSREAEDED